MSPTDIYGIRHMFGISPESKDVIDDRCDGMYIENHPFAICHLCKPSNILSVPKLNNIFFKLYLSLN